MVASIRESTSMDGSIEFIGGGEGRGEGVVTKKEKNPGNAGTPLVVAYKYQSERRYLHI